MRRLFESFQHGRHSGFEMGKWKRVLGDRDLSALKGGAGRGLSVPVQINQRFQGAPTTEDKE